MRNQRPSFFKHFQALFDLRFIFWGFKKCASTQYLFKRRLLWFFNAQKLSLILACKVSAMILELFWSHHRLLNRMIKLSIYTFLFFRQLTLVGTIPNSANPHTIVNCLSFFISFVPVRRVPPHFTIPPESSYDVMVGSSLNVTCVAVGSPMPHVKWQKGSQDITGDIPLMGKNVLELHNIQDSANYTCVAASKLGIIETSTLVKVQGELS